VFDRNWLVPTEQDRPDAPRSLVYIPEYYKPSSVGALVYFTAHSGDLNNGLSRIEKAGGKILQKRLLLT
jgi:predicted enzyme related to lactoylglutathione lyase